MNDEIFKISKDKERAKNLFLQALERLSDTNLIPEERTYRFIEDYYEIIKEMITAVMYLDGYKTLSHVALIEYMNKNYKKFEDKEIRLIDTLRKYRHGIVYYGEKISKTFLVNYQSTIIKIIEKLKSILEEKLKD